MRLDNEKPSSNVMRTGAARALVAASACPVAVVAHSPVADDASTSPWAARVAAASPSAQL